MTESQIMFGCYLATGVIKEAWRKRRKTIWRIRGTVLILAGSMAVFLAVFDNQYAKEKQEMLDTTFYKQVTDSKITDAIQTATDEAKKDRRILPDSPAWH